MSCPAKKAKNIRPTQYLQMFVFLLTVSSLQVFGQDREPLSSAELFTREGAVYGRYEARMRLVAGDGIISSMFLWKDGSEKDEEIWNEI
ncbi:MAG: family 16 glycosylhydrolase, partial [Fibrobacter sp.]|nr:family 16 glycosylhydrolase [Fibrobacter sp.]